MSWRTRLAPIIAKVIAENKHLDIKGIRKALREAYPLGERKRWPYKIWCDEINFQLGTKKNRQAAKVHEQLVKEGQLEFGIGEQNEQQ